MIMYETGSLISLCDLVYIPRFAEVPTVQMAMLRPKKCFLSFFFSKFGWSPGLSFFCLIFFLIFLILEVNLSYQLKSPPPKF